MANMANAIKFISVQRGHDVTEYTLACFGGAGGQHACLVADELGMTQVYIHPLAGVLSAYGMGLAQVRALREEAVERRLEDAQAELAERTDRLGEQCARELAAQGSVVERVEKRVHLKYEGTDSPLAVPARRRRRRCARISSASTARASASSCPTARSSRRPCRWRPWASPTRPRSAPVGAKTGRAAREAGRARGDDERGRAPPLARVPAGRPGARAAGAGAGDHRRAERHHGGGAGLGGRGHGAGPPGAAPRGTPARRATPPARTRTR